MTLSSAAHHSKAPVGDNGTSCQRKLFILSGQLREEDGATDTGGLICSGKLWNEICPIPYLVRSLFSSGENHLRFILIHAEPFSSYITLSHASRASVRTGRWSRTLDVSRPEAHAAVAQTHFTSARPSQNCCLSCRKYGCHECFGLVLIV